MLIGLTVLASAGIGVEEPVSLVLEGQDRSSSSGCSDMASASFSGPTESNAAGSSEKRGNFCSVRIAAMSLRSLVVDRSPHESARAHSKRDELQRKVLMFC